VRSKDLRQPGIDIFFSETHRQLFGSKESKESKRSNELKGSNESHVVPPAAEDPIPALSWAEAESVKTQYTGGKDFFLFAGDMDEQHQLLELLKAFSLFKKWQQSNMQLVFAGYETNWAEVFEEKLASYKYRDDVVLLNDLPSAETARLIAASYAVVYPCTQAVLPLAIISAVQAGIAVIASDIPVNREATAAACWVDNKTLQEGFAKAMMLLYKDENSKGDIIRQMKAGATPYTWQQMLAVLQQMIMS
jgi:glycosyltransferase involved in cell wall biosynthesis